MSKRFYVDNDGDLYDRDRNSLLMLDFTENKASECKQILDTLNRLHEHNIELMMELQTVTPSDSYNKLKKENSVLKLTNNILSYTLENIQKFLEEESK